MIVFRLYSDIIAHRETAGGRMGKIITSSVQNYLVKHSTRIFITLYVLASRSHVLCWPEARGPRADTLSSYMNASVHILTRPGRRGACERAHAAP